MRIQINFGLTEYMHLRRLRKQGINAVQVVNGNGIVIGEYRLATRTFQPDHALLIQDQHELILKFPED